MGNLQAALAPALQNLINSYERDLTDAKAEIERLAALAQSNHDIIWELTQERERLRAALVRIGILNASGGHYDLEIDRAIRNEQLTPEEISRTIPQIGEKR